MAEPTAEEIAATQAAAKAAEEAVAKAEADEAKELGEKGVTALREERNARKAAEKAAKDAADKLATAQKLIDDATAAKALADEESAKKNGEWEKLATDRADAIKAKDTDLQTITSERDALLARLAKFETAVTADMTTWMKDHKEQIPPALMLLNPGDGASLEDRQKWFDAAKAMVADNASTATGLPRTRTPAGGRDAKRDEEARAAQSRMARSRF